jgi:hypothetical protein
VAWRGRLRRPAARAVAAWRACLLAAPHAAVACLLPSLPWQQLATPWRRAAHRCLSRPHPAGAVILPSLSAATSRDGSLAAGAAGAGGQPLQVFQELRRCAGLLARPAVAAALRGELEAAAALMDRHLEQVQQEMERRREAAERLRDGGPGAHSASTTGCNISGGRLGPRRAGPMLRGGPGQGLPHGCVAALWHACGKSSTLAHLLHQLLRRSPGVLHVYSGMYESRRQRLPPRLPAPVPRRRGGRHLLVPAVPLQGAPRAGGAAAAAGAGRRRGAARRRAFEGLPGRSGGAAQGAGEPQEGAVRGLAGGGQFGPGLCSWNLAGLGDAAAHTGVQAELRPW